MAQVAKTLVTLIPATIVAEWVKGHYKGDYREHKHDLNDKANALATAFNANPPPTLKPIKMPCTIPGYAIRLVHDGSAITNKLYSTLSNALHTPNFISYLKCKKNWNDSTFNHIHWDAHERAFRSQTKTNQIMIAKVIHKLVNTNHQNHQFYGKSPLCPCCETQDETLQHILSCTSPGPAEARKHALLTLQTDLTAIDAPPPVLEAILYGTNM